MKFSIINLLATWCLVLSAQSLFADDASGTTTTPPPATAPASWSTLLQGKYNLTDAQAKSLVDSKLPDSEQAKVAQLAKSSGKTVDEVLKMRTEDKMGWGKIAKTLGVHPSELGKAVSDLRKEQNSERKKAKRSELKKVDDDQERGSTDRREGKGKPERAGHGKK